MKNDAVRLDLFLTHRAALVEYALPIVGDRARAEDIVQEAFIRFVAQPDSPSVSVIERPRTYLYSVVRNLAIDLRRRLLAEYRRDQAQETIAQIQHTSVSPEDETLWRDDLRRISEVLAELPPNTQRAFEMHRIGGYTLQEVAEHLGISVATAHRWTNDALKHVIRHMERLNKERPL